MEIVNKVVVYVTQNQEALSFLCLVLAEVILRYFPTKEKKSVIGFVGNVLTKVLDALKVPNKVVTKDEEGNKVVVNTVSKTEKKAS